jgi:hypothetical protein
MFRYADHPTHHGANSHGKWRRRFCHVSAAAASAPSAACERLRASRRASGLRACRPGTAGRRRPSKKRTNGPPRRASRPPCVLVRVAPPHCSQMNNSCSNSQSRLTSARRPPREGVARVCAAAATLTTMPAAAVMSGIASSSAAARLSAREASLHARRSAAVASCRLQDAASKARNSRACLSSTVRAHLRSRGRTSPPPTMSGIRLAPIVDHSCALDVAGSGGYVPWASTSRSHTPPRNGPRFVGSCRRAQPRPRLVRLRGNTLAAVLLRMIPSSRSFHRASA